jgi:hypothetical protein
MPQLADKRAMSDQTAQHTRHSAMMWNALQAWIHSATSMSETLLIAGSPLKCRRHAMELCSRIAKVEAPTVTRRSPFRTL